MNRTRSQRTQQLVVGSLWLLVLGLLAAPASRSAQFMQIYPLVGLLLAHAASGVQPFARRARAGLGGAVCCMLLLFILAWLAGVSSKFFFPVTALALILWLAGTQMVSAGIPLPAVKYTH